jgi:hypothetical protein
MEIKGPLTATWKEYGLSLYIGSVCVGGVAHYGQNNDERWYGWFTSGGGRCGIGTFTTSDEARDSVEEALVKAFADG